MQSRAARCPNVDVQPRRKQNGHHSSAEKQSASDLGSATHTSFVIQSH
jgi:hypothetical protein